MSLFKTNRITVFFLCLLTFFITTTAVQAKTTQTKFVITPQGSSAVTVMPDGMATINYVVTNKLPSRASLVMTHRQGVTQITNGVGVCQNPMQLNSGASCVLSLSIDGSQFSVNQTTTLQDSPQICIATNQLSCSQANSVDWIKISVVPGFAISGTISGLRQPVSNFILTNNGDDAIQPVTNGSFTFPEKVFLGQSYRINVASQPTGQTCIVNNGAGVVTGPVTNVNITCSPTTVFTIGGNLTHLIGSITLQNNGGDNLTLSSSGPFTFSTSVPYGSSYNVTILNQPAGQICMVFNGSGTDVVANVTNVDVVCYTQTAYVSNDFSAHPAVNFCPINGDGSLSSCTPTPSVGAPNWVPAGLATVKTDTGLFVYVTDSGNPNAVYKCTINPDSSLNLCTLTASNDALNPPQQPWTAVSIAFSTVDNIQYAYIGTTQFGVNKCLLNLTDGELIHCTPAANSQTILDANQIAFATINSVQYAYVTSNGGSFVNRCTLNANGTFNTCIPTPSSLSNPSIFGVAFATINGGIQLGYIGDTLSGNMYQCALNLADGTFSSCSATGPQGLNPNTVTIAEINGVQYAYLPENPSFGLNFCAIDMATGQLNSCIATPALNPIQNSLAVAILQ